MMSFSLLFLRIKSHPIRILFYTSQRNLNYMLYIHISVYGTACNIVGVPFFRNTFKCEFEALLYTIIAYIYVVQIKQSNIV